MSCACDGGCCRRSGWLGVDSSRMRAGSRGTDSGPWRRRREEERESLYALVNESCAPHVSRPSPAPLPLASSAFPHPCLLRCPRAHLSHPRRTQPHLCNPRSPRRPLRQGEARRAHAQGPGQRTCRTLSMTCAHASVASLSLPRSAVQAQGRADCQLAK